MFEKLEQLLRNVPDTYEDFVEGELLTCKKYPDLSEKLISYIIDNPNATTSEIIELECDFRGIKKVYPLI